MFYLVERWVVISSMLGILLKAVEVWKRRNDPKDIFFS